MKEVSNLVRIQNMFLKDFLFSEYWGVRTVTTHQKSKNNLQQRAYKNQSYNPLMDILMDNQ